MKTFIFSLLLFFSGAVYAQKDSLVKTKANIDGLTQGTITIQQFRNASKISVSDTGIVVTSYQISAYGKGMSALVRQFDSNAIPEELKKAIEKFPSGTKVYFEYIRAADTRGNKLLLPALGFTLSK